MENKETGRYGFIDLMKVLSIFFVIFYHAYMVDTDILNNSASAVAHYFIQSIFSICVPMFFLVNGFLILSKPFNPKKHTTKMVKLFICATFWNAVCTVLNRLIRQEPFVIKELILGTINADYMWFLQALFVVYVFVPLIKNAYDTNRKLFYWFLGVVSLLTFGNELLAIAANICEFALGLNYIDYSLNFFGAFNAFRGIYGYAISYFMIGGALNYLDKKCPMKFLILVAVISWISLFMYGSIMTFSNQVLYDIVFQGYDKIFTLFLSTSVFLILKKKNPNANAKLLTHISRSTLGIYCIQQPIIAFGKKVFPAVIGANIAFNFLFAAIILLTCTGIIYILQKTPIIRNLISL